MLQAPSIFGIIFVMEGGIPKMQKRNCNQENVDKVRQVEKQNQKSFTR